MNETTPPIMTINDELLAELEAAANAATPGPWVWDDNVPDDWETADWDEIAPWLTCADLTRPVLSGQIVSYNPENPAYIAKANPATILALLQHVREMKQALDSVIAYDEMSEDDDGGLMMFYSDMIRQVRAARSSAD